jgi:hypothetical protein
MEETLIVLIVFGSLLAIVKLALDYARDKHHARYSAASGSSLTSSELKGIVERAVEDVLDERFVRLERQLEALHESRLLPSGSEHADVEDVKPEFPPVQSDRDTFM